MADLKFHTFFKKTFLHEKNERHAIVELITVFIFSKQSEFDCNVTPVSQRCRQR